MVGFGIFADAVSDNRQVAEIQRPPGFGASSIVSSIEFDCNEEFFVTAGVSKRIRIFDFSKLVQVRARPRRDKPESCDA